VTTENVAVLFTDIFDSTALASRLAPEVADELRREHFSILRQAVAEAGDPPTVSRRRGTHQGGPRDHRGAARCARPTPASGSALVH